VREPAPDLAGSSQQAACNCLSSTAIALTHCTDAEAKGIALRANLEDDLPEISADPTRLAQVVWNLLTNTVKFTPAGDSVVLSLVRRGTRIRLIVSDTGCGIAPDLLLHVFERFRQGDARPSAGLGLGLFIVRHIVEAHGGRVWTESDGPGRGATFIVELSERTDGS
jgi:signal transduction histidine kinase